MDLSQVVERFGASVEANSAAILVGAGLSRGAGYPDWETLLSGFRQQFGLGRAFHDLPMLAQFVENEADGRERLIGHVVREMHTVQAAPTENHDLLAEIPVPDIWTTNYDELIEIAAAYRTVTALDDDFVDHPGDQRVLKMHGSIRSGMTRPVGGNRNLVLSRDDYEQYPTRFPRFWQLLQAQFLTRSFLFLGFSMTDPNFNAVFRLVRLATPHKYMDHYALLKRPDPGVDDGSFDLVCRDLSRVGVHVMEIDDHALITEALRGIVARTRPRRLFVAGSQPGASGTGNAIATDGRYPHADVEPRLVELATMLGQSLAQAGIAVAAGGEVGAIVGYALLDALGDAYSASRFTMIRRQRAEPLKDFPNLRRGTVVFTGEDPATMRGAAFTQVRAVVVLAGGSGTGREVATARDRGMDVVPLACSGGTAQQIWEEMRRDLGSRRLGGKPIDPARFDKLADPDSAVAIAAAVGLIQQAMFVDGSVDTEGRSMRSDGEASETP